jgi:two-component system, OmpR family, sensor histidine kinase CiaH
MVTKWTDRINLFRSARLQLTLFYLGIIVLFNLVVTLSVRIYAEHEFLKSNNVQRSEVRDWAVRFFELPGKNSEVMIADIQQVQAEIVREHLNTGLFVINLCAFGIGGLLSYWFAGRALKPLQEAHEAQARFTADASHELRTPLANMRLENEVFLRSKEITEAEAREQIASNLEEVQRLERLSNNLLALHQYGQTALTRAPVSVRQIVSEATSSIKAAAEARSVTIISNLPDATVEVHRESMVQLMDILLDNALKYGATGKEIIISGEKRSTGYILAVKDKGPGLAAVDMPYLFDRLYRGDKARSTKAGGYGLGLALAKEIAQANDATITAGNNSTGGASFAVLMPLAQSV